MPLGGYPVRANEDANPVEAPSGSAATKDVSFFATAAQGAKADSALQPSGNGASLTGVAKPADITLVAIQAAAAIVPVADNAYVIPANTTITTIKGIIVSIVPPA